MEETIGLPTAVPTVPPTQMPTAPPTVIPTTESEVEAPAPTPEEENVDEIPEDPKPYLVEYVHKYVITV